MDDIVKNNSTPNDTRAHRWRVVFFVMIVIICGGLFVILARNKPGIKNPPLAQENKATNEQAGQGVRDTAKMTRTTLPLDNSPAVFPDSFPRFPDSDVAEVSDLFFPPEDFPAGGELRLQSKADISEVREFYLEKLSAPKYQLISDPEKSDTDTVKVLAYSTDKGLVILRFERNSLGTDITATFQLLSVSSR